MAVSDLLFSSAGFTRAAAPLQAQFNEKRRLAAEKAHREAQLGIQQRQADLQEQQFLWNKGADERERLKQERIRNEEIARDQLAAGMALGLSYEGAPRLAELGELDKIMSQVPGYAQMNRATPHELAMRKGLTAPVLEGPKRTSEESNAKYNAFIQDTLKDPNLLYNRRNQYILENPGRAGGADPTSFASNLRSAMSQSGQFKADEIEAAVTNQVDRLFPTASEKDIEFGLEVLKNSLPKESGNTNNIIVGSDGSLRYGEGSKGTNKFIFDDRKAAATEIVDNIAKDINAPGKKTLWEEFRRQVGFDPNATKLELHGFSSWLMDNGILTSQAIESAIRRGLDTYGDMTWLNDPTKRANLLAHAKVIQDQELATMNSSTGATGTVRVGGQNVPITDTSLIKSLLDEQARAAYLQDARALIASGSQAAASDEELADSFLASLGLSRPTKRTGGGTSGRTGGTGTAGGATGTGGAAGQQGAGGTAGGNGQLSADAVMSAPDDDDDLLSDADFENSQLLSDGQLGPLFPTDDNARLNLTLDEIPVHEVSTAPIRASRGGRRAPVRGSSSQVLDTILGKAVRGIPEGAAYLMDVFINNPSKALFSPFAPSLNNFIDRHWGTTDLVPQSRMTSTGGQFNRAPRPTAPAAPAPVVEPAPVPEPSFDERVRLFQAADQAPVGVMGIPPVAAPTAVPAAPLRNRVPAPKGKERREAEKAEEAQIEAEIKADPQMDKIFEDLKDSEKKKLIKDIQLFRQQEQAFGGIIGRGQ